MEREGPRLEEEHQTPVGPSRSASGFLFLSPITSYLGSWLQGSHKVFDHFGFGDCDATHHEEDQKRVVAGMRPAHLQNRRPAASDGGPRLPHSSCTLTLRDCDLLAIMCARA